MDLYFTSQNVITSLKPMSLVRSYALVVWLNGEIYVFGGGNGYVWYDTVESYNPVHDSWTLCRSLNQKKGRLSGAALNDKLFVVGGGNGVDSFSDVEMLELDIGRWIPTHSMLDKRFALVAVEFNGAIYATSGFDGNDYLIVLNEKLYALGGFDGDKIVPSIEVFDPRLGAWTIGEPMNHRRGYSAVVVVKESIYMIGGVKVCENIVDTEEYRRTERMAAMEPWRYELIKMNHFRGLSLGIVKLFSKQRHCNPSLPPCKLIFVLLLGCPLILECHLSQFSAPLGTRDDLVTNFSKFLPSRRGMLAGKELLEPRTLNIVGSCDVKFPIRMEGLAYYQGAFSSVSFYFLFFGKIIRKVGLVTGDFYIKIFFVFTINVWLS
ncbi:Kelch-like protein 18 [Glycine max]|nr:Kelch-like protein 18 [Glycine max]